MLLIIPGKNLKLWVSALKQESYQLYVRKEIIFKNIYKSHSKTLNSIINYNQAAETQRKFI